jgi:hypothetical protein
MQKMRANKALFPAALACVLVVEMALACDANVIAPCCWRRHYHHSIGICNAAAILASVPLPILSGSACVTCVDLLAIAR